MVYHVDPWPAGRHNERPGSGPDRNSPFARHAAPTRPAGQAVVADPSARSAEARRSAGLGWPLLANDMFRLVHRDSDGRLLLDARVAGLGLSAALLGELLMTNRIQLRDGVVVAGSGAAPVDVLAHSVLDQVASEPIHHPVRTWLAYLARGSHTQVAARLIRGGHVREHRSRGLFSRSVRYLPVDMNAAAWPWARLSTRLRNGEPLDGFDTLLAGLVLATDLHRIVLLGATDDLAGELRRVVGAAPAMVRELVYHTEAAVGDAVITST